MRQLFEVLDNRLIARDTWQMRLTGDTSALKTPGQFVNLQVENAYLRRPLSVTAWQPGQMTLIYKVVGTGTDWLARCQPGQRLNTLVGLGNGFDLSLAGKSPLLVGGGVGLPPLYQLGVALVRQGAKPRLVMGFASRADVFYQQEFEAMMPVSVATVDGTQGVKGLVTDVPLTEEETYLYACGPTPMLKALCAYPLPGQLSLEERMGCGFGACMGCTVNTTRGPMRVCYEGPVFLKEELLW